MWEKYIRKLLVLLALNLRSRTLSVVVLCGCHGEPTFQNLQCIVSNLYPFCVHVRNSSDQNHTGRLSKVDHPFVSQLGQITQRKRTNWTILWCAYPRVDAHVAGVLGRTAAGGRGTWCVDCKLSVQPHGRHGRHGVGRCNRQAVEYAGR